MGSLSERNFSALSDSVPLCRQFWKAGEYEVGSALRPSTQNSQNRLRVHPKFLHSNATSHKWAFGAIAELLDNAVDEVQHGATYVNIDQIINPRNGEYALVIQDDGGGLTPDSMRCCMSFGFSNKQADVSIGQYGNGLKTSTMRLGADAIVFSRSVNQRTLTQSVGLLSYTFLRDIVADDIVVPMVDYEFHPKTNDFRGLVRSTQRQFLTNLSAILKWSPFATEVELLKQFDGMGLHGTKIIIFNLWFNDDGCMELDFASDAEDIMVSGAPKIEKTNNVRKMLNQKHIANRYRYSLRVYSSILYMHLPANFKIFLRGKLVEPHHITTDLNYVECINYKPHNGGGEVVTHIGFLKGAPDLNVHGFNVYHRNRLILPFWSVFNNASQWRRSSGVAGVLEANFIRPTHDKQDFEKSTLYQKLETRLKDMTMEYWNYHCHLVGHPTTHVPSTLGQLRNDPNTSHQSGLGGKGKRENETVPMEPSKRKVTGQTPDVLTGRAPTGLGTNHQPQTTGRAPAELETNHQRKHGYSGGPSRVGEAAIIIQTNRKLRAECLEYEKTEKELKLKAERLRRELEEYERIHENIMTEIKSMEDVKIWW